MLFSGAVEQLATGMWGGLPQAEPLRAIKRLAKKASVGFGPWREQAGKRLTAAVRRGELSVYVAVDPERSLEHLVSPPDVLSAPVTVPTGVLNQLITSRGSLQDHPIRPSIVAAEGDQRLLRLLDVGMLLLREGDFKVWYQSEHAKGKWPSQRSKAKSGRGRPTKQTDTLRNAALGLVREERWSGNMGVTKLRRLLIASGRDDVPSVDTLARLVDQLHRETGAPALFRKTRRKQAKKALSK